jgi:transcription elongation factor Elf1
MEAAMSHKKSKTRAEDGYGRYELRRVDRPHPVKPTPCPRCHGKMRVRYRNGRAIASCQKCGWRVSTEILFCEALSRQAKHDISLRWYQNYSGAANANA